MARQALWKTFLWNCLKEQELEIKLQKMSPRRVIA